MGKTCVLCGHGVGKGNLNHSREIECGRCIQVKSAILEKWEKEWLAQFEYTSDEFIEARGTEGWSQSRLALELGMSQQTVSAIENGSRGLNKTAKKFISRVLYHTDMVDHVPHEIVVDWILQINKLLAQKYGVSDYLDSTSGL